MEDKNNTIYLSNMFTNAIKGAIADNILFESDNNHNFGGVFLPNLFQTYGYSVEDIRIEYGHVDGSFPEEFNVRFVAKCNIPNTAFSPKKVEDVIKDMYETWIQSSGTLKMANPRLIKATRVALAMNCINIEDLYDLDYDGDNRFNLKVI